MKLIANLFPLGMVVLLSGNPAFSAPLEIKLSQIFRLDMLNIRVVYLESLVGPAIRIGTESFGQYREYKIAGCKFVAYADLLGQTIDAYSLQLSPRCWFNIDDVIGQSNLSTRGLSVGKGRVPWSGVGAVGK